MEPGQRPLELTAAVAFVEFLHFFAQLLIAMILVRAAEIFTRGSWFSQALGAIFD